MSFPLPPDEVAEDFSQALRDMGPLNSRYEISNLTVIAKENTEHALAISEALKNYIKQTSPQKKLPAFYVLDSIVKNVGTPYTLFFGRQLYSTFMEAYALVDNNTRRKMDEMLKTWKEPVPGSIDTRPVFPPEVTRPIENALIKARTSAVQAQQEQLKSQQQFMGRGRPVASPAPYSQVPTPPQGPPGVAPGVARQAMQGAPGYNTDYNQQQYPPSQPYSNQANGQPPQPHGLPQRPPQPQFPQQYPMQQVNQYNHQAPQQYPPSYPQPNQQYPPQPSQQYSQQYPPQSQYPPQQHLQYSHQIPPQMPQDYSQPYPQEYPPQIPQQPPNISSWQQVPVQEYHAPSSIIDSLNSDIESCITLFKSAFAQNPVDRDVQSRLKTLLDLQNAMKSQAPAPDQLAAIRSHVDQLSQFAQTIPNVQSPPFISSSAPVVPVVPVVPVHALPVQPPPQQPSLSSLLGPGGTSALAALLARKSATPQPNAALQVANNTLSPQIRSAQPAYNQTATSGPTHTPLPDPAALLERLRAAGMLPGTTSTPPVAGTARPPPGFPPSSTNTPPVSRTPLGEIPNDVVLKPASLKIPRPHLIFSLYQSLGNPCAQCGRRFQPDEEGKKKKAAHMDWHFRVHERMKEAEKRGQHRSWYLDELDWIKSREVDEDQNTTTETSNGLGAAGSVADAKPKLQYIPVPEDHDKVNSICPICQEKFEMKWLDDAQEFVWIDARQIKDRIYHASCYAEASKDGSQALRNTPDPVLGKRKAEDEHMPVRTKIKTEE